MSLSDKQFDFLRDVAELIQFCDANGYKITAGELYRTPYQQQKYMDDGLTTTLRSKHLKRLAIDLNFFSDGQYMGNWPKVLQKDFLQPVGDFWESLHPDNEWGGNWKAFIDCPHFQRS